MCLNPGLQPWEGDGIDVGFSFAGTAILTFSYGFLEGLGYPKLSMFTVWPTLAVLWIVGLAAASRRYQ